MQLLISYVFSMNFSISKVSVEMIYSSTDPLKCLVVFRPLFDQVNYSHVNRLALQEDISFLHKLSGNSL